MISARPEGLGKGVEKRSQKEAKGEIGESADTLMRFVLPSLSPRPARSPPERESMHPSSPIRSLPHPRLRPHQTSSRATTPRLDPHSTRRTSSSPSPLITPSYSPALFPLCSSFLSLPHTPRLFPTAPPLPVSRSPSATDATLSNSSSTPSRLAPPAFHKGVSFEYRGDRRLRGEGTLKLTRLGRSDERETGRRLVVREWERGQGDGAMKQRGIGWGLSERRKLETSGRLRKGGGGGVGSRGWQQCRAGRAGGGGLT